jgi:iron complex outermembrane receptor protein
MGNYGTGRLAASLRDGPWRWTLALDNPADVRANTFAYGNPFAVRSAPEMTPLRPRTLAIGLRRDF